MTDTLDETTPAAGAACCTPLTDGVLDRSTSERLSRMFGALADPSRVRLLSILAAQPSGEACLCDLTDSTSLSQPTVSHHMKRLLDAGLVTREQRGRWAYFRIAADTLDALGQALRLG